MYKLSMSIKYGTPIVATNKSNTSSDTSHAAPVHITQRFVHSIPVLWLITCVVVFLNWGIIGLILPCLNVNKTDPNGVWMFGVGSVLGFMASILTFVVLLLLDYGKGPRLWDLTQVFVVGVLTVVEAIWLPIRWRRLFEGRVMSLDVKDYVNVAGRFSI